MSKTQLTCRDNHCDPDGRKHKQCLTFMITAGLAHRIWTLPVKSVGLGSGSSTRLCRCTSGVSDVFGAKQQADRSQVKEIDSAGSLYGTGEDRVRPCRSGA